MAKRKPAPTLSTYIDSMFDMLEDLPSRDRAIVIVVAAKWLCSPRQLEKADADVRRVLNETLLGPRRRTTRR